MARAVKFNFGGNILESEIVNNVEIDDEVYEQGDGDWNNVKAFRTYDEAISFRENLIKEFKESGYKDNWYPKNS